MKFEQQLRDALGSVQPPSGFAERVRGRLEGQQVTRRAPVRRLGLPLALAASLVGAIATSTAWLQHEQRLAAERARDQLLSALRVTSQELESVSDRLQKPSGELQ